MIILALQLPAVVWSVRSPQQWNGTGLSLKRPLPKFPCVLKTILQIGFASQSSWPAINLPVTLAHITEPGTVRHEALGDHRVLPERVLKAPDIVIAAKGERNIPGSSAASFQPTDLFACPKLEIPTCPKSKTSHWEQQKCHLLPSVIQGDNNADNIPVLL